MMFDQLHDPNPPTAGSRHLAEVAERAATIRRRRAAAAGGLGAVALLAAGTVAVAVVDRDGGTPDLAAPLPAAASPESPAAGPALVPSTTVVDPADLPPAVPVNPDPEDLPPAVPVNTTDTDGTSTNTGSVGSGAGDSPEPGDSASNGSDAGESADADSPGALTQADPNDAGDGLALDTATAASLRADDPITAITASGDAVWFPADDAEPIVVHRGGAQRVDFLADGAATIEVSSAEQLITVHADDSIGAPLPIGFAHEVGPDDTTVCGLSTTATAVACIDTAGGSETMVPFGLDAFVGTDLTWHDADTVLVVGRHADTWSIAVVDLVGDGEPASIRAFAGLADVDDMRWAGRTGADLALHAAGTESVLFVTLGELDGSAPPEVQQLDAPHRSVWFDGTSRILVDLDGGLTIDGRTVPGSYRSARR